MLQLHVHQGERWHICLWSQIRYAALLFEHFLKFVALGKRKGRTRSPLDQLCLEKQLLLRDLQNAKNQPTNQPTPKQKPNWFQGHLFSLEHLLSL